MYLLQTKDLTSKDEDVSFFLIIHDFPPSRYQSFFVLMMVPQSIGMTIMKKFTNKQIVKFEWYEKSLSELLDIIDSIDM